MLTLRFSSFLMLLIILVAGVCICGFRPASCGDKRVDEKDLLGLVENMGSADTFVAVDALEAIFQKGRDVLPVLKRWIDSDSAEIGFKVQIARVFHRFGNLGEVPEDIRVRYLLWRLDKGFDIARESWLEKEIQAYRKANPREKFTNCFAHLLRQYAGKHRREFLEHLMKTHSADTMSMIVKLLLKECPDSLFDICARVFSRASLLASHPGAFGALGFELSVRKELAPLRVRQTCREESIVEFVYLKAWWSHLAEMAVVKDLQAVREITQVKVEIYLKEICGTDVGAAAFARLQIKKMGVAAYFALSEILASESRSAVRKEIGRIMSQMDMMDVIAYKVAMEQMKGATGFRARLDLLYAILETDWNGMKGKAATRLEAITSMKFGSDCASWRQWHKTYSAYRQWDAQGEHYSINWNAFLENLPSEIIKLLPQPKSAEWENATDWERVCMIKEAYKH